MLRNLVHTKRSRLDFDASLDRARAGTLQDEALPKTLACLSSNVESNVGYSSRMWRFAARLFDFIVLLRPPTPHIADLLFRKITRFLLTS